VNEYAAHCRVCPACGVLQPLKDRRTRRLQTLFGTVEVEAPRIRVCRCRLTATMTEAVISPVCALLTARCTPELERVQAELGARTSFREAARVLEALLPVSSANHESVRLRTHAVAVRLEAADRRAAAEVVAAPDRPGQAATADASRPIVMLDGAYVRAVPGHQTRNFEAICGKVEQAGCSPRRFALVRSVTEQPCALLRSALREQSWREGDAITVISDGDPALPALARAATQAPLETILDWFHLSMRVRHVEQTLLGLQALEPAHPAPLDYAQADVERLRSLLWNGRHEDASEALVRIASWAESAALLDNAVVAAKAGRLVKLCTELRSYIREQRGRADRLRRALRGRQADLDLACRGHGQPPGQRPHEQASADALDTHRRPPCAAGQGRGAGPTRRIRPAAHPARGVAPQVFDAPLTRGLP